MDSIATRAMRPPRTWRRWPGLATPPSIDTRFARPACLIRCRQKAVLWLDLASQVAAPTVKDNRALMYELGEVLEAIGEAARALTVFRELQAATGANRDVMTRVERLSRVQSGG